MNTHELEYVYVAVLLLRKHAPADPTTKRTLDVLEAILKKNDWPM